PDDPTDLVALGVAFAVRAPRLGHVCVDLADVRRSAVPDADVVVDLDVLPWPEPAARLAALAGHPPVATRGAAGPTGSGSSDGGPPAPRPLRLDGTRLYLDRYWRQERRIVADVRARAAAPVADVLDDVLADGLDRLFGPDPGLPAGGPDRQRLAA